MKSTPRILTFLSVMLMLTASTFAQETTSGAEPPKPQETTIKPAPAPIVVEKRTVSVGLFGGYSLDMHNATDLKLPDVPSCCPGYNGGSGGGPILGLSFDLPLSPDLELVGRLTYHSTAVDQTTSEPITVRVENEPVRSSIEHTLSTTTSFISIEPAVAFRVVGDLSILGGFRIATLLNMSYDQRSVLDPSIPYDFEGGSGVRDASTGDVQTTSSVNFGIIIGARYALPLNTRKTLVLFPEAQFAPMLTSLVDAQSWTMSSFRFMLGLSYAFTRSERQASPLNPEK
jgi:opacity protein-like surface antigen